MPEHEAKETALMQRGLLAAWEIIRDRSLPEQLLQGNTHLTVFRDQHQLPASATTPLLQIAERVLYLHQPFAPEVPAAAAPSQEDEVGSLLLESFVQIRWSFWISMTMSVLLFIVGIILLIMAVARALNETDVSTATLTIAGLSIADFILLFYSRPWQDITTNLQNSQQVKIIATSYLSALSLLQAGRLDELKALDRITKSAVGLLEGFTEEQKQAKPADG